MAAVTIPIITDALHTTTTTSAASAVSKSSAVLSASSTTVGQDATVRLSSSVAAVAGTTSTSASLGTGTSSIVGTSSTVVTSKVGTSVASTVLKSSTTSASSSSVKQSTTVVVVTPSSATRAPTSTSTVVIHTSSAPSTTSSGSTSGSTSTFASSNSTSSAFHLSTPIIAAIGAVAGLVVLVAILLFVLAVRRSRRRKREERRTSNLRDWAGSGAGGRMSVMNGGVHGADDGEEDDDVTPYGVDAGGREDKQLGWAQGQGEKYGTGANESYYAQPSLPPPVAAASYSSPYPPQHIQMQQRQQQQPYPSYHDARQQTLPVGGVYPNQNRNLAYPPTMNDLAQGQGHRDTYASAPRSVSGTASGYDYGYTEPESPYAVSGNGQGAGAGAGMGLGMGMGMVGMAVAPESSTVGGTGGPGGLKDGMRVVVRQGFVRSMEDELMITPGDELLLVSTYDDGWCLCENLDRDRGVVPLNCLEPVRAGGTPITSPTLAGFPESGSRGAMGGMRIDVMASPASSGRGLYAEPKADSVPQVNIQRVISPDIGPSAAPSYSEATGAGSSSSEFPKEKSGLYSEARPRKTESLAPALTPTDPRWSNRRSSLLANYQAANLFLDESAHGQGGH